MSWSIGFDRTWNRDIGYGVPAECDHPDCHEKIDRGLSYVCGGEPYGGDDGCGLYFCEKHQTAGDQLCERCATLDADGECLPPFNPKPDISEWVQHKLNHPSWAEWREAHADEVAQMTAVTEETA